MSDYTLSVNVTGDASKMKKAFEEAQAAAEKLKSKMKSGSAEIQADFTALSDKVAKVSEKIKSAGDKISTFGNKVRNVGAGLSVALTAPLVLAGKSMIQTASNFNENLNKVDVAFGNSADEVKKWANTATTQFGLSKNAALEMTSLFGDMGTSMGLSQQEAAQMSTSMAGLAGDLSSFKNISVDEAMTALNGVFTGETESLKRLGIVMTDTNLNAYALEKGFGKTTAQMSQSEKVALRYQYVMDMSKNAIGDYARTSDGTANSIRTFNATMENLSATLGQHILPIITPIIQKATEMVEAFGKMDGSTQKKILMIGAALAALGPTLIIVGQLISSVGAIVSAFGAAGTAISALIAKMGVLAASGQGVGAVLATLGTGGVVAAIAAIIAIIAGAIAAFKRLWDRSEAFRDSVVQLGADIKKQFGNIVSAIMPVVEPVINFFKQMWNSLVELLEPVIAALFPILSSIVTIIGNIVTTVLSVLAPVAGFIINIVTGIIAVITPILKTIIAVVMFIITTVYAIFAGMSEVIGGFIRAVVATIGALLSPIVTFFSNVFNGAKDIVINVFNGITNFIMGAISNIKGVIRTITSVFSSVFNTIKSIVSAAMNFVGSTISRIFGQIRSSWNGLTSFVQGVFNGISSAVSALVGQVKGFVNGVIGGINAAVGLINKIPGVSIGAIPYLARGTDNWQGGFARMNEGGRGELTYLPGGTVVVPHDISMKYARESARANSGMVVANSGGNLTEAALRLANEAVKRPVVMNINGKEVARTSGDDMTSYQQQQSMSLNRMRGVL